MRIFDEYDITEFGQKVVDSNGEKIWKLYCDWTDKDIEDKVSKQDFLHGMVSGARVAYIAIKRSCDEYKELL